MDKTQNKESNRNWKFDKTGAFKATYYDIIQVIGMYETSGNIPDEERITDWFGDMNLYEIKSNISEERFFSVYEEAVVFQ